MGIFPSIIVSQLCADSLDNFSSQLHLSAWVINVSRDSYRWVCDCFRPRSEFSDPNWYPPPISQLPQSTTVDRQPIYQNQMIGKPPTPQQQRAYQPPPHPPVSSAPAHQSPHMPHHPQRYCDTCTCYFLMMVLQI